MFSQLSLIMMIFKKEKILNKWKFAQYLCTTCQVWNLRADKSLQTELITNILVLLPCDESVVVYSELLK